MKPYVFLLEDDDNDTAEVIIEWIHDDARFGIWFDNQGTSSWTYVAKEGDVMESGPLSPEVIKGMLDGVALSRQEKK